MDTIQQAKQLCDDIFTITGIKTAIVDADMRTIYVHDQVIGPFCRLVRKNPGQQEQCARCDRAGLEQCLQTRQTALYQCYMGLTEAVVPVMDEETVIGYLRFGQILSPGTRQQIAKTVMNGRFPNEKAILEALDAFPETPPEVVDAAIRLMGVCAEYIRLKDILKQRKRNLALQIDQYITEHMADLSAEDLCKEFGLSRSTLYNVSKQAFGTGITEHIRQRRLKRAIVLLGRGSKPVYQVAEEVGIPDANYLAKLIKAETGLTPKKLQKQKQLTDKE